MILIQKEKYSWYENESYHNKMFFFGLERRFYTIMPQYTLIDHAHTNEKWQYN